MKSVIAQDAEVSLVTVIGCWYVTVGPRKRQFRAPVRFVPTNVTLTPPAPVAGENDVTTGACVGPTVNVIDWDDGPAHVDNTSGPVVAVSGTTTLTEPAMLPMSGVNATMGAGTPLNVTVFPDLFGSRLTAASSVYAPRPPVAMLPDDGFTARMSDVVVSVQPGDASRVASLPASCDVHMQYCAAEEHPVAGAGQCASDEHGAVHVPLVVSHEALAQSEGPLHDSHSLPVPTHMLLTQDWRAGLGQPHSQRGTDAGACGVGIDMRIPQKPTHRGSS